jgi:predicted transcriptional regulator
MADACASIDGWRASPYIRDSVAAPEMQISRGVITYDTSMGRDSDDFHYTVRAYVQRDSERAGQIMLDELSEQSGPGSLKTVLEDDERLNDLVDIVRVLEATPVQATEVGVIGYLFVDFDVWVS